MRICFLAGANSIHSHRWANFFANTGHTVFLVSFAPSTQPIHPKIQYVEIHTKSVKPFHIIELILKTRQFIRTNKPDILHAHSAGIYGFIALMTGFHPFILTAWGSDVLINPRSFIKKIAVKRILRAADLITCDGENTKEAMMRLGANNNKIHLIRFGVDTEKFKPVPNINKKKLLGSDAPAIISVRNLELLYDIETLIRAAEFVAKKHANVQFIIGGDGEQKEYLQNLTQELSIEGSVKFIGAIPGNKMPLYFNAADIYVSTALSDSDLAASTAEAMATELPVIITDSGDNRKWVRNGENGFIIPIKSPEVLAEKILYLLNHPQEREKFAKANRAIIKEKNDYTNEMGKMEKLYEKTIATN